MNYPLAIDYIDSIKFAKDNFASLTDLQPVYGIDGNPIYIVEGKCIIFKMENVVSGMTFGVKCFLTEELDRVKWYNDIIQSNLFFSKESQFIENELYVDSEVSNYEEFPVFIYPWIERMSLIDYIQTHIDNQTTLLQLSFHFGQILKWSQDNDYIWKELDITKIFINAKGQIEFAGIDELLLKKSINADIIQLDVATPVMLLLSLRAIALSPDLFDYDKIKNQLLFTVQDEERIVNNDVFQKLLQLDNKEINSLIGYLLVLLTIKYNNGIDSSIFCLTPTFETKQDELLYYAECGDDNKQVELARFYFNQKVYDEAYKWYKAAADQGNPDGINGLGCCYKCGGSVEKDEKYAVQLFSKAADMGSIHAQLNLAMAYYTGNGIEGDFNKAFLLFKKLAEKGEARAQYFVGNYLMHNHLGAISWHTISKRDTKEAFKWFEKSALQGHSKAQQKIGMFFETGTDPCIRNIKKAFEWYLKSANQGNTEAIFSLGRLYANGIDEENPDVVKAYQYFLQAAESGHPEAQYRVGVALYYGKGVDIDKELALSWLEKSAKNNWEAAQNLLYQLKSEQDNFSSDDTVATQEEMANAQMDSYGVLYSADGKKLLHYGIDDMTKDISFGLIKQQSLREYVVPEGVEIICENAFEECQSLIEIILPSTLKQIGSMAFYNCANLESITIPEGIKLIDYSTFKGCSSLHNLVLPHSLESIDGTALTGVQGIISYSPHFVVKKGCLFSSDLKTLIYFFHNGRTFFDIPYGTECIGDSSFKNSTISNLNIPSTVITIESSAFEYCQNLHDIDLPSSITEIGSCAFWECRGLYRIELPNKLKCIDVQTFEGCRNLKYINIPEMVEEIGSKALAQTNLNSVVLPKNLKKIGAMVFILVPLSKLESHSDTFIVDNMTIYSKDKKELIQYYGNDKKFTVPNTVVRIAKWAFACAYSIKELIISDSVEEIGEYFLYEALPEKIIVPVKLKETVESLTDSYYHSHIIVNE